MHILSVVRVMMLQTVSLGAFLFFFVHLEIILDLSGPFWSQLGVIATFGRSLVCIWNGISTDRPTDRGSGHGRAARTQSVTQALAFKGF